MTDRQRMEEIYIDHYDAVLRFCLRRSQREDAIDAASETFVVAWRRRTDIPVGHELPWLYGVARNVLSHHHRSTGRYTKAVGRLGRTATSLDDSVADAVLADEAAGEMLTAMGRLTPSDREVIRLAGWEELDREEVAVVLKCSPNAATKKLNRALDRLANELGVAERSGGRFFTRRVAHD